MLDIKKIEEQKKKFLSELDNFEKEELKFSNVINKEQLIKDNDNIKDSLINNRINDNYYNKDEININNYNNKYEKIIYIILIILGFIILVLCGVVNIYILLPEIILNICLPYIYIPVKVLLCQIDLRNNIKKIYNILFK